MYDAWEFLPISALQHLVYCERQCALIHVEGVWVENEYTARGRGFHRRAHYGKTEVRGSTVISFGMNVACPSLGVTGITDCVELTYSDRTLSILVSAEPIEYKSGAPKRGAADTVQLCAQAMALESMLGIPVDRGALYYGASRGRTRVQIDEELRRRTTEAAERLHDLVRTGQTPMARYARGKCGKCSLFDICRPDTVSRTRRASRYTNRYIGDCEE